VKRDWTDALFLAVVAAVIIGFICYAVGLRAEQHACEDAGGVWARDVGCVQPLRYAP
jgi:hypothetical protein